MKTLRKLIGAALLTGVLTVSVNAGEMWTGYTPPPPPPTPTYSYQATEEATDENNPGGHAPANGIGMYVLPLLNGLLIIL